MQTNALLALTALATNDQLHLAMVDVAGLLLAASSVGAHLKLKEPPHRMLVPSSAAFHAAYFLLVALLRQHSRLVHASAPLLLTAIRGLLYALAHGPAASPALGQLENMHPREVAPETIECARNMRRLLEQFALHRKVLVRHSSYLLADIIVLYHERPLPAAAQEEVLPGIHAVLGMCTEVEVQAVHAASEPMHQRILKDLLESYQRSFKYKGKA